MIRTEEGDSGQWSQRYACRRLGSLVGMGREAFNEFTFSLRTTTSPVTLQSLEPCEVDAYCVADGRSKTSLLDPKVLGVS